MAAKRRKDEAPQRQPPDLPPLLDGREAITEGEPIEESRVVGIDLSGRKLSGLAAKGSIFESVSFAGCHIPSPRFRDVRLVKCDLSNATLRGFEATRVEFIDCRLTGMIAIECRWQDVLVENCDGRYAQISDGKLHTCEFKGSNFAEADFRSTDLESTIFTQATLTRADFGHSKLRGSDLRGADIDGIIVGPEEVRGAIVSATQAMDLARLLGLVIK
jgi:uncharacterized protein YjbI with pentapeptide repeats